MSLLKINVPSTVQLQNLTARASNTLAIIATLALSLVVTNLGRLAATVVLRGGTLATFGASTVTATNAVFSAVASGVATRASDSAVAVFRAFALDAALAVVSAFTVARHFGRYRVF